MKKLYSTLLLAISFVSIYAQCPVQVQMTPASCNGSCDGTATAFGSGGGPYTYIWNPTGQTTQTATGLCGGTTYSVIVINAATCTGTTTATIPQPSVLNAVTTGQNSSSCINCNGMVIVSASGGTSPYTYAWAPSGCTTTTCTGLCAGTYTCTVTDSHGCTATAPWTLTSLGTPSFTVSATPANNPNCNNGTATASVSSPGTFTYAWTPTSQTTMTATGLTGLGIYTVCVTNTGNGCSACQPVTVNCTTTGIQSQELILGAKIYPNPATNNFTLEFSGEKTGEMNLEIFNLVGEEIFQQQINVARSLTKQIDVSTYPKGIYFVRIKGPEGSETMKLIVN